MKTVCQVGKWSKDCNATAPESSSTSPCLHAGTLQTPSLMEQPTPHKRKPGRPRKAKPAAGIQTTQSPSKPESNPLEATIKAARKAYEPSNQSRSPIVPRGTSNAHKDAICEPTGEPTGATMGAAILAPLPSPRAQGKLASPAEYASSFSNEQVEAWATAWICSGNRQRWLREMQPGIGRENDRWRADLIGQLERHPVALETIANLKSEQVMSDLQRRKLLRQIAETESHPMRGASDRINAIKVDAELDPESTPNRLKQQKAESNSLTFNAPVSLFFMPSTQARAISPAPEPKQVIDVAKACPETRYNSQDPAAPTLPPVGGTPRT